MRVDFGANNTIYNTPDDPTTALITSFLAGADLTIDPGEALKLGFFFAKKAQAGGYSVSVTLEGGLTTEVVTVTLP